MGKWGKDLEIFSIPDWSIQKHRHLQTGGGNVYTEKENPRVNLGSNISEFDLLYAASACGKKIIYKNVSTDEKIEL